MRVAITGGTGFVGAHTARVLSEAGHDVVVVSRGTRRRPPRDRVSFVRADLTRANGLVAALTGCDAVINLVAIIRERGTQTFDRVNREGAANVAQAVKAAGVAHLVHLSALGAGPNPRYPYLESKWAGEQEVRIAGVPHTILRSSLIFGPGDGFFTVLTKLIRFNPVVPIVGDGRALFQPIAAWDVARCLTVALERGPDPAVAEIGGPDHLSYETIVDIIRAEIGAHRLKLHVPTLMMLPVAAAMERLLPHPPLTPGQLRLLEKANITRLDAVPTRFGFQPDAFARTCSYLHDY